MLVPFLFGRHILFLQSWRAQIRSGEEFGYNKSPTMLDKGHSGTAINNSYLLSSLLLLSDKKRFSAQTRGDILENYFLDMFGV